MLAILIFYDKNDIPVIIIVATIKWWRVLLVSMCSIDSAVGRCYGIYPSVYTKAQFIQGQLDNCRCTVNHVLIPKPQHTSLGVDEVDV